MLQTIHRPDQVAMDQVARVSIVSRMHAWFRRCFDEKINGSDGGDIIAHTNVTMHEFDTARAQPFNGQFRAATFEVVEDHHYCC